ncbi:putative quinol monooxygenase [Pseudactinotalea sp.]|uniref:putative quinol monooxygenase n=1 Tax=Pseudactinotalea sp. TaxID=1926260 RepID=UPI003B3B69D3
MIIIAGHTLVDAADRDANVAAFRGLVTRAREADGCLHFSMTADSVDPGRTNMLEIWRDADALDAWRKRARGPRATKPHHVDVKRYDAADGGPLF